MIALHFNKVDCNLFYIQTWSWKECALVQKILGSVFDCGQCSLIILWGVDSFD